jgi:hypothetical protein
VNVRPLEATVLVDGRPQGTTPLTLTLSPGLHTVRVEKNGYQTLEKRLVLSAGEQVRMDSPLVDVSLPTATATPVPSPTATFSLSPVPSPSPTPSPLSSPSPPVIVTPTPVGGANVYYETTLSIDTYPYADYLWQEMDVRYGIPLWRLDRIAYDAAYPTPAPQTYRALVVENEYLQLTFLPELGGRLYRCVYKPTGQNIFYQNPVVKPSRWGPLTPAEHNWWLAVGGMEWALPVYEHGYEFGIPWDYSVQVASHGISITLWDAETKDRLRSEVQVTLPSQRAAFIVRPQLTNPLPGDVRVQLWVNAMLTLGSPTLTPETEFILPAGPIVVHSTGDATLAAAGHTMTWPSYDGRDLSRYANWRQWLGLFIQQPEQDFVGAYNHATEMGVARVFSSQQVSGVKLFAFGSDFGDRTHYTDDDSQYFELWGGPNRTFWSADDVLLPAGDEIAWEETWLPFAGIGGLTFANEIVTLYLGRRAGWIDLGLSVSTPIQGWIRLMSDEGDSIWEQEIVLSPASPLLRQVDVTDDVKLNLVLIDRAGEVLLDFSPQD